MKRFASMLLVLAVLALVVPVSAHHSFETFWDMKKTATVTGVVKAVKLVNPHANMVIEVTDASGQKSDWNIISRGSVSTLRANGWKEDTVTPGMRVTIEGNPSRTEGAKGLVAGMVTKPDGSKVSFGATPE